MELELENMEDGGAVETLFDLCFGGSRAMLSSYRLRAGVGAVASLCFVLREGGVVGAIRYWPVNIVAGRVESVGSGGESGGSDSVGLESGGSGVESVGSGSAGSALLLGPVAVHPTHQGEGLGGVLIRHSLAEARLQGWTQVILIGDASYYGRYGFARADLDFPPPTDKARVLMLTIND